MKSLCLGLAAVSWVVSAKPISPILKKHIQRGQAYLETDPARAQTEFEKALMLEEHPTALKGLGWASWKMNQPEKALPIWEKLVRNNPRDVTLLNQLAKIHTELKNTDAALKRYEQVLSIEPHNELANLGKAQIFEWEGNYQAAIQIYRKMVAWGGANLISHQYKLGKSLFEARDYAESSQVLDALLKSDPSHVQAKALWARSEYHLGHYERAIPLLQEVKKEDAENTAVRETLALYGTVEKDYNLAKGTLTELIALKPTTTRYHNQLGTLEMTFKEYEKAIEILRKSLAIDPSQVEPQISIAESYLLSNQLEKAENEFNRIILKKYPNIGPRLAQDIADIYYLQDDMEQASKKLKEILDIYPQNLAIVLRLARFEADQRRYESAKNLLNVIDHEENEVAVPALLYHRVSPFKGEGVVTQENFEKHLIELKKQNYTTITSEQLSLYYRGKFHLPPKPILITFDDAIKDVQLHADPLLEKYGFKATMFVPISIIDKEKPFFMSWNDLINLKKSGRWEIQCHSDKGHEDIVVNESGSKARFLINREWLVDKRRLETEEEFKNRITDDYASCKRKLEEKIPGVITRAFAFPYGDFGVESGSNSSMMIDQVNLNAVKENFDIAFVQYRPGFNLKSTTPWISMRLNVPETWDGKDLINFLTSENPLKQAKAMKASILAEEGKYKESLAYIRSSQLNQMDANTYHERLSIAYQGLGNNVEALEEWQRSSSQNVGYRDRLDRLRYDVSSQADFGVSFFNDSNERNIIKPKAFGKMHLTDHYFASAYYDHTFYQEDRPTVLPNERDVQSDALQAGLEYYWDARLSAGVIGGARRFSTGNISPEISSFFNFPIYEQSIYAQLNAEYRPIEFSQAIHDENRLWGFSGLLGWSVDRDTTLKASSRLSLVSDDNAIRQFLFSAKHVFWRTINLYAGYTADYRDSDTDSSNYYAPQNALQNFLELGMDYRWTDSFRSLISYAAGLGYDDIQGNIFIQQMRGRLDYALSQKFNVFTDVNYGKSPSYRSSLVSAGISTRF